MYCVYFECCIALLWHLHERRVLGTVLDFGVFSSPLRTWGSRKWVIWREFFRELRTWQRPPWSTCDLKPGHRSGGEPRTSFGSCAGCETKARLFTPPPPPGRFLTLTIRTGCAVSLCQSDAPGSRRERNRKSLIFPNKPFLSYSHTQSGMQPT